MRACARECAAVCMCTYVVCVCAIVGVCVSFGERMCVCVYGMCVNGWCVCVCLCMCHCLSVCECVNDLTALSYATLLTITSLHIGNVTICLMMIVNGFCVIRPIYRHSGMSL